MRTNHKQSARLYIRALELCVGYGRTGSAIHACAHTWHHAWGTPTPPSGECGGRGRTCSGVPAGKSVPAVSSPKLLELRRRDMRESRKRSAPPPATSLPPLLLLSPHTLPPPPCPPALHNRRPPVTVAERGLGALLVCPNKTARTEPSLQVAPPALRSSLGPSEGGRRASSGPRIVHAAAFSSPHHGLKPHARRPEAAWGQVAAGCGNMSRCTCPTRPTRGRARTWIAARRRRRGPPGVRCR